MGFLVQNKCHETIQKANDSFISSCGFQSHDLYVYYCEPPTTQGNGVVFIREHISTGVRNIQHTPMNYPSCEIEVNNTSELAWLVVGVWVVAWGVRKMIEVLKR